MKFEIFLDFVKRKAVLSLSVVVFLGCMSVYLLHSDKKANLDSEIELLDARMSMILKNLKNSFGLEEDLAIVDDRIAQLDARLFDSQALSTNYSYFYKAELATGVKLIDLRQLEVNEGASSGKTKKETSNSDQDSYQKIRYHMSATGSYGELVNFMRKLEGGPSFYRLEKFRVSQSEDRDSKLLWMDVSVLILGRKIS